MARQNVNTGTSANDGTGDTLRSAGNKINFNFQELYSALGGDSSELSSGITLTDDAVVFEGSSVDNHETFLKAGNPTGDVNVVLPNTADTLVGKATTDTLTNKTLTSPVLTTPQINDTSSNHQYIIAVSELAADRTITLPLLVADDQVTFNAHTQTLTNKTLTTPVLTNPRVTGGFNDANGNEFVKFVHNTSAVNELQITNNSTGNSPNIAATGTDANISLEIYAKGTGAVSIANKLVNKAETLTSNGACSTTLPLTIFNSGSALAMTLAAGSIIGETKYFINRNSGTATVTANMAGSVTTVAFTASQAGFMIWSGADWHLLSKSVAT